MSSNNNTREPDYPVQIFSSGILTDEWDNISGAYLASGGDDLMTVASGGIAIETDIGNGGMMVVEDGGIIKGINVNGGTYSGAGYCSGNQKWYGPAIGNTAGTILLSGGTFVNNYANEANFGGGNGGAVETWNGSDQIADCLFSSNSAGTGGGAYLLVSGSANLSGNEFLNNSAVYGGAVQNHASIMTLSGGVMIGNSATAGGAFENHAGGSSLLENVVFSGNSATSGGAIFNDKYNGVVAELTANNCTFIGNAGQYGAAVLNTGSASFTNCTFSGNAGEYSAVENYTDGTLTITSCTFTANAGTYGGGIANQPGATCSAVITDTNFSDNTAGYGGAAICNVYGNATITGGTFTNNSAGNDGGAIANWLNADISGAVFSGNIATSGGAISHLWAGTLNITGTVFTSNTAHDRGGAIVCEKSGDVTISNCTFSGNTAASGGAIYNAGIMTIANTEFTTRNDTVVLLGATTLSGTVSFAGTITAKAAITNNGTMILNLADQTPDTAPIVSDFSKISGGTIQISVSGTQQSGTYQIAAKADQSAYDIVLSVAGTTAGVFAGSTGTITVGDITYTLDKTDGDLALTIAGGSVPPVVESKFTADVVLTITDTNHAYFGATGAWKVMDDQKVVWQDLSTLSGDYQILGLGKTVADKAMSDVYVYSASNKYIGAYVTDANGAVAGFESIFTGESALMQVGLGDFNADGISDLMLRTADGYLGFYANGAFTAVQGLGTEWSVEALGDVNGDGTTDIVIAHAQGGYVGAYLIGKDGGITWGDLGSTEGGIEIVGSGDFNADGTDDVLV
ncbi:MAG: hypothetical protein IJC73_01715, partial [Lentisphaeria bacterium]|nr:hypothetical protein [Lentisphaeria bacterium]